jgi:hypothetical protein
MSITSSQEKQGRYWLAGGHAPVPHLTEAALRFASEHSRLLDFHVFFTEAAVERLTQTAQGNANELAAFQAELRDHRSLLVEVVICRVADNFLSFVSDLLAMIYQFQPEMLKSSEQERIDFVLQFESMEELRVALAEKRVERLAYLGLKDLADYLSSKMGFELFPNKPELERAALIVEYRNLFVHNRGVISSTSARRFKEMREHIGKRVAVPPEYVREFRQFLENSVIDIDIRASKKFSLPVVSLPEPPEHLVG